MIRHKHNGGTVNPWKDWEVDLVRQFYGQIPTNEIAMFLCNRTGNGVRQKWFDMKHPDKRKWKTRYSKADKGGVFIDTNYILNNFI